LTQLKQRIASVMGITELNPLQVAMAHSQAKSTILLAPTGSGKTLAFTLPMLVDCDETHTDKLQAVVIAPSRELVLQINDVVRPLALPLRTAVCYGGHSMLDETRSLEANPQIIIATPGRLLDHFTRGHLQVERLRMLVLDEYDKSLELGFLDDMRRIVKNLGRIQRVILTSATQLGDKMPRFLDFASPEVVDFTQGNNVVRGNIQYVKIPSATRDKLDTLLDLTASLPADERAIIFVNHRESAQRVYDALKKAGFPAGLYHGALDQQHREIALEMFNNGTTPILVATDLGSRGLDIADVGSVIHYHLPLSAETWTHRNGRTARQGADGIVYTILSDDESIPDFVEYEREYVPHDYRSNPPKATPLATLYFNAGKREKISRGDIAGYLMQRGGLASDEVGRITVKDHYSLASIPADKVES
ncbi:MAG: DEAD/DEAH box helicase, partial [Muribaculaceae bacterium]|nr:DEAD/DEAH box helicase [Muribaculaceae bacterium]